MTSWPWPWSEVIHGGSRDQSLHQVWRSVLQLWVLTSPIRYHWQCVSSHCTCAVSRDLYVGGKCFPHIWNPWPWFAYSLYNFYGATIKTNGVIHQNSVWPCDKDHTTLCACAKSWHPGARCHKSFTTIVLGDHNFALNASNFGKLTTFRAIFSHIFTAHAPKRLFMNFRLKFWHHHSIPWPRFPYRAWYFANLRIFSVVFFCIGYGECPPYFYFQSSWPMNLESVSRDAYLAVKVSTKFEVDTTIHCLVIALLLLIRYMTLWPWSVVIHGGSRGQLLHQVWRSDGYPF